MHWSSCLDSEPLEQNEAYKRRYDRFADRMRAQWPIYFWAAYVMTGVVMLALGYVYVGIAILVVAGLVFAWGGLKAGLKRLTADPWR